MLTVNGLEILKSVPSAKERGSTLQVPPPVVRPIKVALLESLINAGTKLPQENETGDVRTNGLTL